MADAKHAALLEVAALLVQDERRDALRALRRIRDRRDDEDLADPGMRDEPLGAVQQVVAVLLLGRGPRATGIAAGAFFREAEAAEHLAAGQQRYVLLDLRPGAKAQDRGRAKRRMRADRDGVRGADFRELFDRDHEADRIEAGAADIFGPRDPEKSELSHGLDVRPGERGVLIVMRGDRGNLLSRKAADHVTHGEMLLVEIKTIVHGRRRGQSGRCRPGTDCFVLAGGRTSVVPKQRSQAAHWERTSGSPK